VKCVHHLLRQFNGGKSTQPHATRNTQELELEQEQEQEQVGASGEWLLGQQLVLRSERE